MTSPALADDRLRVAKAAAAEKESDAEQRRRIAQLPQPTYAAPLLQPSDGRLGVLLRLA